MRGLKGVLMTRNKRMARSHWAADPSLRLVASFRMTKLASFRMTKLASFKMTKLAPFRMTMYCGFVPLDDKVGVVPLDD